MSANVVFEAQNASTKALRELCACEEAMTIQKNTALNLQTRLESDLVWLDSMQVDELKEKVILLIRLRMEASRDAALLWESFGKRLDSAMGDSVNTLDDNPDGRKM